MATLSSAVWIERRECRIFNYIYICAAKCEMVKAGHTWLTTSRQSLTSLYKTNNTAAHYSDADSAGHTRPLSLAKSFEKQSVIVFVTGNNTEM